MEKNQRSSVEIVPHNRCTGCGACYNKCPINAITMEYDAEGFIFPQVSDACVNCGACVNACSVVNPLPLHPIPSSYAVWADNEIRAQSSSGGMFTLLANEIISQNGVVCGAKYSDDFQLVYHAWATNNDELAPLRGSKYVQSETRLTYREAKEFLEQGRPVLYTGCPCQIAGLYKFLGKDYPNLYTADIVCHGSNSVTAYQSFLEEFTEGQEIEKVDFRDKKFYSWSTPTVVYLKNGNVKKAAWNEGFWNKGFLDGVINRQNCFSCVYARRERVADITMADCWQVHRINPAYDDRRGTSLVLVNSEKGRMLFDRIRPQMLLCEPVPLDEVKKYNGQLRGPTVAHPSRKFFFSHLNQLGYHKALWYGRGMRFDVGIVGWWFASNYGSSLTYYALGTILENMGKQILFVPIAKENGTPWEPEIQFTVDFLAKYFHIGKTREYHKMNEYNQFCDSFMLGSDQMWTGGATDLVGYTFFLDFVDKNKKKIAFSTSFGHSDFYASEEVLATAGDFLRRFDAVSVREKSGVGICRDRFGINAEQIIDPVFMCPVEQYDRMTEDVHLPVPEKYLLCYILDPTPEKEAAARAIAEHEGIQILAVMGLKEYWGTKDQWNVGTVLPQITTEEFLYYVKNCSYLLTDSHHGTCFGIIYQKPYAAVVNADRGTTRFETVADALDLRDRLFNDALEICDSERPYSDIDYSHVAACIKRENDRAFQWLKNALDCPVKIGEDTIRTMSAVASRQITGLSNQIKSLESRINSITMQYEKTNELVEKLSRKVDELSRHMEEQSNELAQLQRNLSIPLKFWKGIRCLREHGLIFTIRKVAQKLKKKLNHEKNSI